MKIKITHAELLTANVAGIHVSPELEIEATPENAEKARTVSGVFGDNALDIAVSSSQRLAGRITDALNGVE